MNKSLPQKQKGRGKLLCVCAPVALAALVLCSCSALWPARDAVNVSLHRSVRPAQSAIRTEEITAAGPAGRLPLRLYRPDSGQPLPVILYYHGGGWVYGGLDTHSTLCAFFAAEVPALVVAVDYRLAPQHKFPAAVEDAYAALLWTREHAGRRAADPNRIAVCGDSAGGNLAAAVCLMARDRGGPKIVLQVLAFPVTNLASFETESYRSFGRGKSLTRKQMAWFREQYLQGTADRINPYASPLLAQSLRGLPPALVITGEQDVLRDEAEAYAQQLQQQGIAARSLRLPGQAHAAVYWASASEVIKPALDAAVAALRSAFAAQ